MSTVARTLAAFILAALLPLQQAAATEYVIDPTHTYASFEIDHLGFSTQRGLFRQTSGTIEFDPAARTGQVDIRIAATSIDTGFEPRDTILRNAEWLNVDNHPDLIYRSTGLVFRDQTLVAVDGTLMMLGEIRPLRLEVTRFKCGLNLVLRKQGCGADAQGVLKRSDFGFNNGQPFIGDEVRLRIQVEAYRP